MTVYLDNARLSISRAGNFNVELEEENVTMIVARDTVEKITKRVGYEEENFIILILAYIDFIRRERNGVDNRAPNRISEDKIVSTFCAIYNYVDSIESLIEIFRNLKWHEIRKIFNSDNPIDILGEYL